MKNLYLLLYARRPQPMNHKGKQITERPHKKQNVRPLLYNIQKQLEELETYIFLQRCIIFVWRAPGIQ
jgi:hypothetical protein